MADDEELVEYRDCSLALRVDEKDRIAGKDRQYRLWDSDNRQCTVRAQRGWWMK